VLLEVGHIVRPHGVRGEVIVELLTTLEQRLAPGSELEGLGRRFVVETAQAVPGKLRPTGGRWIVRFSGVGSREEAERLRGTALQAQSIAGLEGLWVHEIIGATVVDVAGAHLGKVVSIEANPASDLLVLEGGALVPLRFVTTWGPGVLTVDAPPGLFDL
jgi:16S rRNA processing protein RimM